MINTMKLVVPLITLSLVATSALKAEVLVYKNLHVREKSSVKSDILGQIPKYSLVFVKGDDTKDTAWLKISEGYIYKKYTSRLYGVVSVETNLNIRKEPSFKSQIIGQYSDNKMVPIFKTTIKQNAKWYKTDRGWIYSKYVIPSSSFKILDGYTKETKKLVAKVNKISQAHKAKDVKPKKQDVTHVQVHHKTKPKSVNAVNIVKQEKVKSDKNIYVDVGYSIVTYSHNGTKSDFHPRDYKLDIGYIFADLDYMAFAVETGLLFNAKSDKKTEVTLSDGTMLNNAKATLDQLYYVELKAIIPLFEQLNANVYAGGNQVKMLTSGDGYKGSNDWDYGFAYGAGLEYVFKNNISLHTDYMIYFTNIKAIDFGLGYKF